VRLAKQSRINPALLTMGNVNNRRKTALVAVISIGSFSDFS
jgi:hypothetical protein